MFIVSKRTLKLLAVFVWTIGGVILLLKARSLLIEANTLNPQPLWLWAAVFAGLCVGGAKAHFLFVKSCRRNIVRINNLSQPKLWQFFKPTFFLALALMISTGATLSRLAHGKFPFLLGVAILDLSISVALLGSSVVFWQKPMPLNMSHVHPFD